MSNLVCTFSSKRREKTRKEKNMGFRNGSYATVFGIETKSNTMTTLNIATSRKHKETGSYETDFSGFVACIGTENAARAAKLKERDRIRLADVEVTTVRDPETRKTKYTNFTLWQFHKEGESGFEYKPTGTRAAPKPAVDDGEVDEAVNDDTLPF